MVLVHPSLDSLEAVEGTCNQQTLIRLQDVQADISLPLSQADISLPWSQADMSLPWSQADMSLPWSQADMSLPWSQADMSLPWSQADMSFPWSHKSFCRFCCVLAHILEKSNFNFRYIRLCGFIFLEKNG